MSTSYATAADLLSAVRQRREDRPARDPGPDRRHVVVVRAAHGGAGGSTIAVALADALTQSFAGVSLIEVTRTPGLVAVATHEVASSAPDWRSGVRGGVRVERPLRPPRGPDDVPPPPVGPGVLVIDTDWSCHELGGEAWNPSTEIVVEVVVARPTIPAVARVEDVLEAAQGRVLLVIVGARKWPTTVLAALGPRARALQDCSAVVFAPLNHRLQMTGIGDGPAPAGLARSASRIVELLDLDGPSASSSSEQASTRWWSR